MEPTVTGNAGTTLQMRVGQVCGVPAIHRKLSKELWTMVVRPTHFLLDLNQTCGALCEPLLPGNARDMDQSSPSTLCHVHRNASPCPRNVVEDVQQMLVTSFGKICGQVLRVNVTT